MSFFTENIGTIIVLIVLCVVVFYIIKNQIKSKKSGKSSCGCGCSSCAMAQTCHSNTAKK